VGTKVGTKTIKNEFEEQTYSMLLEKLGPQSVQYETLKIPYVLHHDYVPDFRVQTGSGDVLFIETKGNGRAWTPQVRKKMLAVKEQHPEYDIRFLFYSDGEFGTKRKDGTRVKQSEWSEKHGFPYAIKNIPESWYL
jgi:hypothetical protein